jgi:hypothetical protein
MGKQRSAIYYTICFFFGYKGVGEYNFILQAISYAKEQDWGACLWKREQVIVYTEHGLTR